MKAFRQAINRHPKHLHTIQEIEQLLSQKPASNLPTPATNIARIEVICDGDGTTNLYFHTQRYLREEPPLSKRYRNVLQAFEQCLGITLESLSDRQDGHTWRTAEWREKTWIFFR